MMINRRQWILLAGSLSTLPLGRIGKAFAADTDENAAVRNAVDDAVKPILAQYGTPGLAVGVTIDGRRHFVEYGLASQKPPVPVTRDTLFELGSISKTFTATLATLAEIEGKLALTDMVGQHMPELKGTPIGDVRLLDLATHTAGGFPLQLPGEVTTPEQLIAWYRAWKPKSPAGTMRTYANPSIGLLGLVTAKAMGEDFATLMESRLFPALGLKRTYINVPEAEMASYAWGTNRDGKPVRVGPSPIATEAYGVKSNVVDMLQFLEVNLGLANPNQVPEPVARAVAATHTGYYRAGPFIQDLIWEQYPTPVKLDDMTSGNSAKMSQQDNKATAIAPPMPPRTDLIFNKTGSTGGFGAYVFGMPEEKFGIALLANKFYPNEARTKAGYAAMARLVG
jgi:beta-lactamase class C